MRRRDAAPKPRRKVVHPDDCAGAGGLVAVWRAAEPVIRAYRFGDNAVRTRDGSENASYRG